MVSYWESNIHQVLWMEVLQCLLLFLTHNSNLFTAWLKANALFAITNELILFLQNDAEAEMKSARHKYYLTCQDLSRVSSDTFLIIKGHVIKAEEGGFCILHEQLGVSTVNNTLNTVINSTRMHSEGYSSWVWPFFSSLIPITHPLQEKEGLGTLVAFSTLQIMWLMKFLQIHTCVRISTRQHAIRVWDWSIWGLGANTDVETPPSLKSCPGDNYVFCNMNECSSN